MGAWDGAECCELVGLYLLNEVKKQNIVTGLYRDDGISISSSPPRETEKIKKKICQIFSDNSLNITICQKGSRQYPHTHKSYKISNEWSNFVYDV